MLFADGNMIFLFSANIMNSCVFSLQLLSQGCFIPDDCVLQSHGGELAFGRNNIRINVAELIMWLNHPEQETVKSHWGPEAFY